MRRSIPLYLVVVLGLAGCAVTDVAQPPTDPAELGRPQLAEPVPNQFCDPNLTSAVINADLDALFFKNSWPDVNSVKGKFKAVEDSLDADNIDGARTAMRNLVGFIDLKYGQLTPAQQAAAKAEYDKAISDLWCFVGISGLVFDLNPGDPEKAFDIPGTGGVQFPANAVPTGTLVSLTDLTGSPCPLSTTLDCFPGFLSISIYPNTVLTQAATVVLCPPSTAPSTLAVGHQSAVNGFQVLPVVPVPTLLANTCTSPSPSAQRTGPAGWLASVLAKAANLLLPSQLEASALMFGGGVGGAATEFSPFGVVNTNLSATGGVGGAATEFVPPALSRSTPSPSAAPAMNPPLPPAANLIEGTVGTSTTGLPSVTVKTFGGDANGVNPIPGMTVTFTTAAAQTYDPDSEAKVCDAQGTVPASGSVSVITNASGVATLPCLSFGTKAGFANLSATFDPTSLNFPGSDQITITASDGTTTGTSLNWLVHSKTGPAASIKTLVNGVEAQSYSYGSGLTAFSTVSPAPQVIVTDAFGNLVANQAVYWNATTSNGGVLTVGASGTPTNAAGTAQVDSWLIGDGLNQATAGLFAPGVTPPANYLDATFSASTPTGISVFACTASPGSKTDLGPMSIKAPNATMKKVTIMMSITGQSNALSNYDATLEARLNGPTGTLLKTTTGKVQLPGDNGNPVPVTFTFPTSIARQTGNNTIWFLLTVAAPTNRKPQVWYNNGNFKSNDPCSDALVYAPGSTTVFKRGLSIDVTN